MKFKMITITAVIAIAVALLSQAKADDNDYRIISNPNNASFEQRLFFPKPKEEKGYFRGDKYIEYGFLDVSGPINVDVPPLWISKSLSSSITNEKTLADIIQQVIDKGVVVGEDGAEVARLTGDRGLIVSSSYVVVGGYLEPVYPINRKNIPKGERYLGFINKNCFLAIVNQYNQEVVLIPLLSGEFSATPEYADFDYGPVSTELNVLRPLITKQGKILGWARNNGYIYDTNGRLISIGPRCETITIKVNIED